MRFTRVIHHSIPIKDPITICVDFENNLLAILKNLLRGKNFAGVYIHDVVSIVKDSITDIVISNDGSDVGGTVELDMIVETEEFIPGEIICDMKIGSVVSGVKEVFGKSLGRFDPVSSIMLVSHHDQHMTGSVNATALLSLLQAGNIIPIRCVFSVNEILVDKPAIGGRIYTLPGKKVPPLIVHFTGIDDKKNITGGVGTTISDSILSGKTELILKEIGRFKAILSDFRKDKSKEFALKTFDSLIEKIGIITNNDSNQKFSLLDENLKLKIPSKTGYYCRDYRTKFLESEVFFLGTDKNSFSDKESNYVIPAGGIEVINILLFEYLQSIKVFCGFITNYSTEEEIKNHSHLWKFYLSLID